jgi:anti-sigma regulatory factor (Ser/Thr protein kinase)
MGTMTHSSAEAPSVISDLCDPRFGGCAMWRLPLDETAPVAARAYFSATAATLGLGGEPADDGAVAVSELVTNAHRHARTGPYGATIAPELWIYPRSYPQPRLVVTVFDACRDRFPQLAAADPLADGGRGLRIVAALAAETGCHLSRSRGGGRPVPGKAVWFTLPLDRPWPGQQPPVPPAHAARHLHALLISRGLTGVLRGDRSGLSLVSVRHDVNVWVNSAGFCLAGIDGTRIRRPLADLQDVAELIMHRYDTGALYTLGMSPARPRSRRTDLTPGAGAHER